MKRNQNYSSSDSDMDENIEVEKDSGDEISQIDSPNTAMSPSTKTQVQARKRRRGIIEKRRRDRINNSLSELRRLVPSAFEKQGSAKLEKAEILQMTVDHLKTLHAAGGKGYFDAHALAKDYRSLGFRECLAEAAHYLSIMEGRDSADPLRLRLVSHLSGYASQREAHGGLGPIVGACWGSAYGAAHHARLAHPLLIQRPQGRAAAAARCSSNSSPPSPSSSTTSTSTSSSSPSTPEAPGASRLCVLPPTECLGAAAGVPLSLSVPSPKVLPPHRLLSSLSAFPLPYGAFSPLLPPGAALSPVVPPPALAKPYRPWGTEIGAF